jgi:hypothetical protein
MVSSPVQFLREQVPIKKTLQAEALGDSLVKVNVLERIPSYIKDSVPLAPTSLEIRAF